LQILNQIRPLILVFWLVAGIPAAGSALTFGNVEDLGLTSYHAPTFILGEAITVPVPFLLTDVGILFKNSGYDAQVGIYTDLGGLPDVLVADSGIFAVSTIGHLETAVPPVALAPGDYWFMAIFDGRASVGYSETGGAVVYQGFQFGDPLYDPFSDPYGTPQTYVGQDFNYYLVGQPIPEPGTAMLLGLGLVGLASRRS